MVVSRRDPRALQKRIAREIETERRFAWGCEDALGVPHLLTISNADGENEGSFTRRTILRETIPFPVRLEGISAVCILSDGSQTLDFGMQIRDSQTEDDWYQTLGEQGRGAPVPARLVCGSVASPFRWPAPRILPERAELSIEVTPKDGTTIKAIFFTFLGRRLRGSEYDLYKCSDPRETGYIAIIPPPIVAPFASQGVVGAKRSKRAQLHNRPYDVLISRRSVMITREGEDSDHANGDQRFTDQQPDAIGLMGVNNTAHRHDHESNLAPTTMFAETSFDSATGYRQVAAMEGACWRWSRLSSVKLTGAMLARDETQTDDNYLIRTAFHGQRVKPEPVDAGLLANESFNGQGC